MPPPSTHHASNAHHASNGSGHVITNENLLTTLLSTRNDDELDDVIHRLKTSQMTSATMMLVDHVRRIERQVSRVAIIYVTVGMFCMNGTTSVPKSVLR